MHTLLYTESQPMLGMAIVILIIAALLIFVIYQLKKKKDPHSTHTFGGSARDGWHSSFYTRYAQAGDKVLH